MIQPTFPNIVLHFEIWLFQKIDQVSRLGSCGATEGRCIRLFNWVGEAYKYFCRGETFGECGLFSFLWGASMIELCNWSWRSYCITCSPHYPTRLLLRLVAVIQGIGFSSNRPCTVDRASTSMRNRVAVHWMCMDWRCIVILVRIFIIVIFERECDSRLRSN
jgi:hypothetical protein